MLLSLVEALVRRVVLMRGERALRQLEPQERAVLTRPRQLLEMQSQLVVPRLAAVQVGRASGIENFNYAWWIHGLRGAPRFERV